MKKAFLLILFLSFNIFIYADSGKQGKIKNTVSRDFVFGEERPFKECHASTIIYLGNGEYMIAWFGGTHEKHDDVGIWMSKGKPGAWSEPYKVAKIRNDAHWNPVLFKDNKGLIHLYFKVGKEITDWETWEITSDNEGKTWTDARELVKGNKGGRGPVCNKPIILSDGTWLAGASFEKNTGDMHWDVFIDRSEDNGETWTATPYIELDRNNFSGKGVIQPTLWESALGRVHMLVRSTNGKIYRSDSNDYGITWCKFYPTDMPNNNSGIDLVKLQDGTLVLAYNPVSENWGSRAFLNLAVSYDNGLTWPEKIILEDGSEQGEYSYPAIIAYENKIALTYTWKRQRIAFREFEYEQADASNLTMIVGTYTSGSSEGIYTYKFNASDLTAQLLSSTVIDNPSYLTVSPDARYIYAVSESGDHSSVSAFVFDKTAGTLRFINKKQVGADPCFITYDELTKSVATANYTGGSVSIIGVDADGSLTDQQALLQYEGYGKDPVRQTKPHLHCITQTPDKKALFATDLGTDKIHKIEITTSSNKATDLTSVYRKSSSIELEPGSGPRHLIFNKKGSHAYLINELSGMVTVFAADTENNLIKRQSILADTHYAEGSADIHLSDNEKFLYASTRLKGDRIVIFGVNKDGTLKRTGYYETGKHPRNFAITPDGNLMLVACKDDGIIQILKIEKQTGLLIDSGKTIPVDQPVCIKFVQ
ncbi:MAG: beta-propeller fold lactonase family protein [Tannerella sp.]|jgi:6-phosphogluconolactonase (cycloisomerase 2 family)/predicted neuraminidase|nr:beta-propeller fold lactonase family protein [Tannerella sp.]